MRYSVFLGMTYSLKCSEDSFTGTKVRAGIAMEKIPASAVCCKAISAKTGECSHKIEAHSRVHRIWTAARNEAVFFAYRVVCRTTARMKKGVFHQVSGLMEILWGVRYSIAKSLLHAFTATFGMDVWDTSEGYNAIVSTKLRAPPRNFR